MLLLPFARRRLFLAAGLLILVAIVAGACAPATPEVREVEKLVKETVVVEKEVEKVVEKEVVVTPTPAPGAPQPVTLTINLGTEPPSADPSLATDTTSVLVLEQLFLGLTDFDDATGEVVPELATEWSANDDLTVWTFKMRDDIAWVRYNPGTGAAEVVTDDNGNPVTVTAHDVVFGVKRTCDPRTASDYSYVDYIIAGCQAVNTSEEEVTDESLEAIGVRAVDDYTVEFTLGEGVGFFPSIAGMWINRPVYAPVIAEKGARWVEPGFIVTNGPYVMTEWVHGDRMTFERNPNWPGWQEAGAGSVERIQAFMVVESSTAFAMYENHEIDYTGPPLEEMDRIRSDATLSKELSIEPILCTYYYGFSADKPPTDNPVVRRALGAAINRQVLVEQVIKGGQLPANTFAPEGIFGNAAGDPDIAPELLDPELGKQKAREWMAEAGFPDGAGLDLTLMYNTSEAHRTIAEAVQAMWAEVFPQLNITVENQEWRVYLQTIRNDTPVEQRPHVWRLGWCADYPDQHNWLGEVLSTELGANNMALSEDDPFVGEQVAQFNGLIDEARGLSDPDARAEIYRQAEKLYMEEIVGITPIYYYTQVVLVKPWVTDWVFSKLGGEHFYKWSVDWNAKQAARGG